MYGVAPEEFLNEEECFFSMQACDFFFNQHWGKRDKFYFTHFFSTKRLISSDYIMKRLGIKSRGPL